MPNEWEDILHQIGDDVADIRQDETCSNCQHFTLSNIHTNWGVCGKLHINANNTITLDIAQSSIFVFGSFGCNQWQTK